MKPAPATVISEHFSGRARVIGLFLARLLACLLRLREQGEATPPPHIAKMVSSADEMVHAYICNLAAMRLKTMGYTHAARALRTTRADRPVAALHTNATPTSPDELIARLEATIIMFDEAEALSAHFARLVFCALCMVFTAEDGDMLPVAVAAPLSKRCFGDAQAFARQRPAIAGRGPPDWPPPADSARAQPLAA